MVTTESALRAILAQQIRNAWAAQDWDAVAELTIKYQELDHP